MMSKKRSILLIQGVALSVPFVNTEKEPGAAVVLQQTDIHFMVNALLPSAVRIKVSFIAENARISLVKC